MPRASMQSGSKQLLIWLLIAAILFLFIYNIRSVLLPFVVGMLSAYFLDPAADRLDRAGIRRSFSTLIITALFFTVFFGAALLILPTLVHQGMELLQAAPGWFNALQDKYGPQLEQWLSHIEPGQADALREAAKNVAGNVVSMSSAVVLSVFASGIAFVNALALILITPLVTFYLLRDWDTIVTRLDHLLPRAYAGTIRTQLDHIDATLAGFIRGQLNVCLILAVYYALTLSIIGLQFGLVIGIASGLLVILPFVGILFMTAIALIVGLLQFGFTVPFALVVAVYVGGQVIEGYFLTPKLVGSRVGLHPLWIIFGMLAGGALFGLVGVLLAVPVTAVIGVLIRFALEQYLASPLYHGK